MEPPVVIETERLLLRRVTADDLHELIAIQADPEVERFMGPFGTDEANRWLERVDQTWAEHGYGRLVIIDRTTGRVLGRTGLAHFTDLPEPELGWMLRRDAWGRAYATEAARGCASWAFGQLDLPCLAALIEPSNERSQRVARRLGMAPVREQVMWERQLVVHAVAREDWTVTGP